MNRHFIHYLRREIKIRKGEKPDAEWYALPQEPAAGFLRPVFHVTRRTTGPSARIEAGDIIWLVSALASPWGTLPPSIDARIDVIAVERLPDGRTRFVAGEDSQWLRLADATALLARLRTVDREGRERPLIGNPRQPAGLYMRTLRELRNPTVLANWCETVLSRDFDFISYRIRDGLRPAFELAQKLVAENRVVFWDRYCLPRRLVERREYVADEALDEYLLEHIDLAGTVWGVETPLYGDPDSYAWREAQRGRVLGKYHSAPG